MNYDFPIIQHINDVLPHIEGFDEIIVADRGWYKVVNYMVSTPRLWEISGPDDLGALIRRECRGIIFDADGWLLSRPIHKGFNLNEKPETQQHQLDWTKLEAIQEKRDGSMIRPFAVSGELIWGTKMGKTDLSRDVADFVSDKPNYIDFARKMISHSLTAVFEWTAPTNQIVVNYDKPELTLLLVRENLTGRYLNIHSA